MDKIEHCTIINDEQLSLLFIIWLIEQSFLKKNFREKKQQREARNPLQDFGLSKEVGTEAETKTKQLKTKIVISM